MKIQAPGPASLLDRRNPQLAGAGSLTGLRAGLVLVLTAALASASPSGALPPNFGGRAGFWRGGGEARGPVRAPESRGGDYRGGDPRTGFGPRRYLGRGGYEPGLRPGFEAGPYGGPPGLYAPRSDRYGEPAFRSPPREAYPAARFRGGEAPGGEFARGQILPPGSGGFVPDPRLYHLRRPPTGYGWVTVGPNAYLTQRSTGMILDKAPLY